MWKNSVVAFVLVLAVVLSFSPNPISAGEPPTPKGSAAPLSPQFQEYLNNLANKPMQPGQLQPINYGAMPATMDLSHIDRIPVVGKAQQMSTGGFPSSFDWRTQNKVTPVENQLTCGTCWLFGTLASLESRICIGNNTSPDPSLDFSEQSLVCCTDPSWVYLSNNRCNGTGNSILATDMLIKKGTKLESCDPYNTNTINSEGCSSCAAAYKVTGYRMIAWSNPAVDTIKNAIYNYGPVSCMFYMDSGTVNSGHMYPGFIYYYPNCPSEYHNHIVCIVGWDDAIAQPTGGGYGAWIVKNSWGSSWGNSGYFYFCYGSGNMMQIATYYDSNGFGYKNNIAAEKLYYWDEAGWIDMYGGGPYVGGGQMACVFTASPAGRLTYVDFVATSNNASYTLYVYNGSFGSLLTSQSGTCQEAGYYSIPLNSPVTLNNGQQFTVAVSIQTPSFNYPIPVEMTLPYPGGHSFCNPPIQTGVCYARWSNSVPWYDIGNPENNGDGQGYNINLRARVYTAKPTVTTNAATSIGEYVATLNGTLTDDGGEACQYRFAWDTDSGEPYANHGNWSTVTKTTGHPFTETYGTFSSGTKYYFRAEAKNSAGENPGSELTFTTKPNAPTGFTATAMSTSQIDLSWTNGTGAQKTMIRRSDKTYPTAPDKGDEVYFDTGNGTSDTGLTVNTTFYYSAWSWVEGSNIWSGTHATAQATTQAAPLPDVVGDYAIKCSIKFFDWKCNKWIDVKGGTLHITEQDKHKVKGYWEPQPPIEGWPTLSPVNGYVGPFVRDAKRKIKNTPRLSLLLELGEYCAYPTPTYVTYILNAKVKMDKKTELVKSIKGTINGWGEYGTAFDDGSPSQGQFEGKFTATLVPAP